MMRNEIHREITPLAPEDSFLVFERVKNNFDFPVHFHPEYELNFIANGAGVRRVVGDSLEEIENIELVFVGPNLHHGWQMHKCTSEKIHEITVQFHKDLLDSNLLGRRIMKPIKDMFEKSSHGILFSRKISKKILPKLQKLSKTDSINYFLELISILQDLSLSTNQRLLSTYSTNYKEFENSDRIKVIYEFIQENYSSKITLSEVSELINMSPVSFNRFIKKRTGKTFVEYVNDTRIGFASRWLIEEKLSITEIAYKCGFNNIANFNRIFKKNKKCTPSHYREEFSGIKRVL